MSDKKTLTFSLMDGPFENGRTVTALRLIDIAARRGYNINVFAYEGAVGLPFARQEAHPNAVHGHDVDEVLAAALEGVMATDVVTAEPVALQIQTP